MILQNYPILIFVGNIDFLGSLFPKKLLFFRKFKVCSQLYIASVFCKKLPKISLSIKTVITGLINFLSTIGLWGPLQFGIEHLFPEIYNLTSTIQFLNIFAPTYKPRTRA